MMDAAPHRSDLLRHVQSLLSADLPAALDQWNKQFRIELARQLLGIVPHEVIEVGHRFTLHRCGSAPLSYLCMIEKPLGDLVYLVVCEAVEAEFIGSDVRQISIWLDDASVVVQGITERVFELLLQANSTIGGGLQSHDGQQFWRRRMTMAASIGCDVGIADMSKQTIEWRDRLRPYRDWIDQYRKVWDGDCAHLRSIIRR